MTVVYGPGPYLREVEETLRVVTWCNADPLRMDGVRPEPTLGERIDPWWHHTAPMMDRHA